MQIAIIREIDCVGCGKCIPACPVDAIIGAPQLLHGIFTDECIGCGLCVAPCPMDCIEMQENPIQPGSLEKKARALHAKERYLARQQRLLQKAQTLLPLPFDPTEKITIRQEIKAAIKRLETNRVHHASQKSS